ncbi:MAG: hypothetical protein WCY27_00425 [archaeon]|jgi:hypothetical protein|nr:hypothetical protein [archaeon]MDD3085178.1 hypothetical protein [Candidatus ainarchaeum sp.]MDD4220818.1 hypothetical protein [Candidatus ainarchaeum sp.]MDD4662318.1 hypothetical protein [Candidatus ainarchaeum sp.]
MRKASIKKKVKNRVLQTAKRVKNSNKDRGPMTKEIAEKILKATKKK